MALREQPLAVGDIHRNFELDVLAELVKHKATMHGCPVWKVQNKLDGSMAVWFKGPRDGVEWEGALRWSFPFLKDKGLLWNVTACSEAILQMLSDIAKRGSQPLIQRAKV